MPASLLTRDPPVPIVVVPRERILPTRSCGSSTGPRRRRHRADDGLERRALATGENALERLRLTPVDRKPVGLTHVDDPPGEPAPVPVRNPLRRVLPALLVPVHLGRREREVAEVAREPGPGLSVRGAKPRIVGLARGDHMLDVGLGRGCEAPPRVRPVHGSEPADDVLLDRLGVRVGRGACRTERSGAQERRQGRATSRRRRRGRG